MVPYPALTVFIDLGDALLVDDASGNRKLGSVVVGLAPGSVRGCGRDVDLLQVRLSPVVAHAVLGPSFELGATVVFRSQIGLTPKRAAALVRFDHVAHRLAASARWPLSHLTDDGRQPMAEHMPGSGTTLRGKAPLGTRILRDARDWEAMTDDQVIAAREKANRAGSSRAARIVTGLPDRRTRIKEATIDLPGRRLMLRVHRPKNGDRKLPLIVSFHGGGFIAGTAAQNDWLNSYLAARCPAVVVSVEYRLAPQHPLPQPVEDGYDTLVGLVDDAVGWGIDPAAVAVMGESAGGMIAALIALRARKDGPPLRAQVLNYPTTDWTETMADYPSIAETPTTPRSHCLGCARAAS